VSCGDPIRVTTGSDSWIDQKDPGVNKGTDSALKVRAKSGEALRSLVAFAVPAAPAGCELSAAELRLYANSERTGRTLTATLLGATFTENGVTWANQPAVSGAAATTTSAKGWRSWNVGTQLDGREGTTVGFSIRDASESSGDAEQSFASRENGSNRPELVVTFAPVP
jgi:hypothetical protein